MKNYVVTITSSFFETYCEDAENEEEAIDKVRSDFACYGIPELRTADFDFTAELNNNGYCINGERVSEVVK